jgi:hypothetical protein
MPRLADWVLWKFRSMIHLSQVPPASRAFFLKPDKLFAVRQDDHLRIAAVTARKALP